MEASAEDLISRFKTEKDCFKKARYLSDLHIEHELTLKEIASKIDYDQSYISHYLRILNLPDTVVDGYYAGQVSCAHLMILSRLKKREDIIDAYRQVLEKNLNTTQTEILIRGKKFNIETNDGRLDPDKIRQMKKKLAEIYPQLKIEILQSRIKGKMSFELADDTKKTSKLLQQIFDRLISAEAIESGHESLIELD